MIAEKWMTNLDQAPKETRADEVVLAVLSRSGTPEPVIWRWYDAKVAREIGAEGYWDYDQDNIAEITGGVHPSQIDNARWTVIKLPK